MTLDLFLWLHKNLFLYIRPYRLGILPSLPLHHIFFHLRISFLSLCLFHVRLFAFLFRLLRSRRGLLPRLRNCER